MTKTTVSAINWKDSFLSHPFIAIDALQPIHQRILIKELTDDGVLTILPALSSQINDVLELMEGCFSSDSNIETVLAEYYGKVVLKEIKFDFNGVEASITREMTAKDAKIEWLKKAIRSGYKGVTGRLTSSECRILTADPEIKELIERYRA
ncbi:MAG: hypothetical protein IJW20_07530 [Clostridia bacterium]|nr:hypothetical protein [Clostridia bacterium]